MREEEAIEVLKRLRIALATANVDGIRVLQPLNIAIESCEKQVAKKPVNDKCSECHEDIRNWTGDEPFKHCPECGQKIDWSVK